MKFGVVVFPGTCDDRDALKACELVGESAVLWHADRDLRGVDAVIVPGGFSYGDYLRVGAIARFAPMMDSIARFAAEGGPVMGICNGFQVLCEAGLLPGALLANVGRRFLCRQAELEVQGSAVSAWTRGCIAGERLSIPLKHTTGRYYAPEAVLDSMEAHGQIVLRYAGPVNPNGSARAIAGICNEAGNVFGLMPHPEHAVDELCGSTDGLRLLRSVALAPAAAA
ncbi:MAG: phosphoribosylformylglycinamidine synthase subunit PurQ [Solirubrobacteraceae bacterium]